MCYKYVICFAILLMNCATSTSNVSRQFEDVIHASALSADGIEVQYRIRSYYVFNSNDQALFDDKGGYFINEDDNLNVEVIALLRSAVKSYTNEYTIENLTKSDSEDIEIQLYDIVKSIINTRSEKEIEIRINELFIEELTFSEGHISE